MSLLRRLAARWKLLAVLSALVIAGLVVGLNPQWRATTVAAGRSVLAWAGFGGHDHDSDTIYWCPMHPQIKRNRPNEVCPICNMALVPLEGSADATPHQLVLTPQQVQQAGVVYRPVLRRRLSREIDTTGRLEYDETRLATITSWIRGRSRITTLHADFKGMRVERSDPLAELYSPELVVAQNELLSSLETPGRLGGVDLSTKLAEAARQRLREQGMTAEQIAAVERTGEVLERVPIESPIGGTVTERMVREGDYVMEGDPLLRVVDLSRLWLFADVYEEELPLVEEGQPVTINVPSLPGEQFDGKVAFVDPEVQRDTRTVRVRIEVENAERRLKPGFFARVQLRREFPETLAVPDNAILWSGQRSVAIVRAGEGTFEPREVRLGRRWLYPEQAAYRPGGETEFGAERQRYHEVLDGLRPGDEVVIAGAFLLNAEAQFQSVLTKMLPPESRSATLAEVLGDEGATRLRAVLEAYYALTDALAHDRLDEVDATSALLADAAEALAAHAEKSDRTDLAEDARQLAHHARGPAADEPADLGKARVAYGRISRATVALLEEHGGNTLLGEDLFLFRCGMAKVGYENWLWWSPEKHNPYMGRKMPTCGTELKTFRE